MISNGYGTYRCTAERDFLFYDALPLPVRDMLKYVAADWAAPSIMSYLRDAFELSRSRSASIEAVRQMIAEDEAEDAYRTFGPTHPQANSHGRRLSPDRHGLWSAGRRAA